MMTKLLHERRRRFFRKLLVLVILLGGLVSPVYAQGEAPDGLPDLFSPVDSSAPMERTITAVGEVIRNRLTEVDTSLIVQLARGGGLRVGDGQPDFAFNLFVDVTYPAYIRGVEEMENGAVGLYGVVSDKAVSEFVLVVHNGVVQAYIQDGINTYEIRYHDGTHVIVEVDASVYPDSLPPLAGPEAASAPAVQSDAVPLPDSSGVIDVLGVYTTRAKNTLGGAAAIEARIEASIISANLGYANSGVAQRLRLVGIEEVNYDEIIPEYDTGISDDEIQMWYYALSRLAFGHYGTDLPQATYLSEARSYREAYGADLVFMLADLPYVACGLGFMGGSESDSEVAYSVVHWYCSGSSAYSVQHELGHNMGACHDRANTDDTTKKLFCYSSDYSFGYWLPNNYYTVMAYPPCIGCGQRINYWSNPNVTYEGVPTGVDVGSDQAAYNALTLNNTADVVANYRQAVTISARFTPSGAYDRLTYPRTWLDVEASSPNGPITQVAYLANYDNAWHTLTVDNNPADGWAYFWNTAEVGPTIIHLRAIIWDSTGQSRVINLLDVPLALGASTPAGFTARETERGVVDPASDVPPPPIEVGGEVGLSPLPIEGSMLEGLEAQVWRTMPRLTPVRYLYLQE